MALKIQQKYFFFIQGSRYYRFGAKNAVDEGYPQPIAYGWPGVPDDIDAVFTLPTSFATYFFKGSLAYKYDDKEGRVAQGYPKKINEEFKGDYFPSSGFDSVFHFYLDDVVYFFKGLFYWKLNANDVGVQSHIKGPFLISTDWKDLCVPNHLSI